MIPELKVRASAKWALFSDWDRAHQSVHSLEVSLRPPIRPRKLLPLSACRTVVLPEWRAEPNVRVILDMNERPANGSGNADTSAFDLEAATRRLMSALDALEDAVERRRDSDRDENELARLNDHGPLEGWEIHHHPLVFAITPVGLDAQVGFTLHEYGQTTLDALRADEPEDPRYWWQRRGRGSPKRGTQN